MKSITKLYLITLFLLFTSCSRMYLTNIDTSKISHDGTNIYFDGNLVAQMSALEIAHDRNIFGGRITRECTFIITDQKYDYLALHIIKYMRKKKPSWEIEVEIKKPSDLPEPKK